MKSKGTGHKVNTQKSTAFLCISNEEVEFEFRNNAIYISTPKSEILGISLTKYVEDLYEEINKTLMNKIKEELNKWRDVACSWIKRLSVVKISVLPNLIYKFNVILFRILADYFADIDKLMLKFIWRDKRPRIANIRLKEEGKV